MRKPAHNHNKVLHVCTIPLTARTFIGSLARYLEGRGYEVTIACSSDPDTESGSAMAEMRAAGFRMKEIPLPRTLRPIGDARAIWKLYQFIQSQQFTVVHTQTSKAGFVGRCAARLARVPVVIHTAHAFPFHPYLRPAVRRFYAWLERLAARWADLIMVDTDGTRAEGLKFRVASPARILTIPMGIDLDRFSPTRVDRERARAEWRIVPDQLLVGTVARLVPDKGLECFLDAAARVAHQLPGVQFVIIGGGPLRSSLELRAIELGIADRVIFAGVRSDIPDQMAAMDLFVLPTLREGFGVVFAEAMAMQTPVIGSDIVAVREVITHNETGLLLPPNNPSALAEAILALLLDEPRRRMMGAAGRRRVEELFNEKRIFARIEAEYHRLLSEKNLVVETR